MRVLLATLFALTALAGCADDPSGNQADGDAGGDPGGAAQAVLPADISATETVTGSVMGAPAPLPVGAPVGLPFCQQPTSSCFAYPFTVEGDTGATVNVRADLTWMVPAHDFDLYIVDPEGMTVLGDGAWPPADAAMVEGEIGPGDYTVLVNAYFVGVDTFNLNVAFTA